MAIVENKSTNVTSTLEGRLMTIDTTSRFVYEQYIKIYENKYSFIREITANAFDAVIELWETKYKDSVSKQDFLIQNPIVLGLYSDSSGNYVGIKETHGIGISPKRMQSYLEITNSSKRESEHQIGAKGIGRLSALAYQNEYYIETVYENIKYYYMVDFYDNAPKVTLTMSMPTNEPNHTKVKVYVSENLKHETEQIENYINKNLAFFENLVVEQLRFKSAFESIKYSEDDFYLIPNSGSLEMNTINLILGSVYYHFGKHKLGSNLSDSLNEKINTIDGQGLVLKFNVSDLDVVASRDTLQFNKKTVEAILNKVSRVADRIDELQAQSLQELWDDSPNKPSFLSIRNILTNNSTVTNFGLRIYDSTKFRPHKDLIRFKDFVKKLHEGLPYCYYTKSGAARKSKGYYYLPINNAFLSDRKLKPFNRINATVVYQEDISNPDVLEIIKKLIPYIPSSTFIQSKDDEETLDNSLIGSYFINNSEKEIRNDTRDIIDNFDLSNSCKLVYDGGQKGNYYNLARSLSSFLPELTIVTVSKSKNGKLKKISNFSKDVVKSKITNEMLNKMADSLLISSIVSNKSIVHEGNDLNFGTRDFIFYAKNSLEIPPLITSIINKHGFKNNSELRSFASDIESLIYRAEVVGIDLEIDINPSYITPELKKLYEEAYFRRCKIGMLRDRLISDCLEREVSQFCLHFEGVDLTKGVENCSNYIDISAHKNWNENMTIKNEIIEIFGDSNIVVEYKYK